jgi:hypothetical protein
LHLINEAFFPRVLVSSNDNAFIILIKQQNGILLLIVFI